MRECAVEAEAVTANLDIHSDAHLRAGENRVLAKVLNKPHASNFSVRVTDKAGRPPDAVVWECVGPVSTAGLRIPKSSLGGP